MYLQTSRLQYNLQGVVLLQTAFSNNKFGFHRMLILSQSRQDYNTPCMMGRTSTSRTAALLIRIFA